jgi:hypothetical protein
MRRSDVAHILRAARALTNEREFVVVGSQAAHAGIADLPDAMQQSGELDLYPLRRPELADVIEGAIGEGSQEVPDVTRERAAAWVTARTSGNLRR